MPGLRQVLLWLGLVLSLPGAAYASLGFVYFMWLEGVQQWPAGRAGVFAWGALTLAVLCAGLFIYCAVSLTRLARKHGARWSDYARRVPRWFW